MPEDMQNGDVLQLQSAPSGRKVAPIRV